LPLGQAVARVKHDARHGNRGRPVDDRIAESFLRKRSLPRSAVCAPEADDWPAVVGAGLEDVYFVSAVRPVLDLPDLAGDRIVSQPEERAMPPREYFRPCVGATDEWIVGRHFAFLREPQDLATKALETLRVVASVRDVQHAVAAERDRPADAAGFTHEDVPR